MQGIGQSISEKFKASGAYLLKWLRRVTIVEKLYNTTGLTLFMIAGISFAFGTAHFGIVFPFLMVGGILAIPLLYAIVTLPEFGIIVILLLANFLFVILRLGLNFPVGTMLDALQVLLILGFFIKQKQHPDWKRLKGNISIWILIWILFNLLELANPEASSRLAWLYTIRSVAFVMLMYFVFRYQIRTIGFIKLIIKLWLFISFLAALYALKQEFIGFTDAEMAWLNSDPAIADLLFIDGHWRKYSFFSDPVEFAYNMAISTILCVSLITGNMLAWKKWVLFFLIAVMLFAMLQSGTRGAFVLVPAGLAMLAVLKYNRQVLIFSVIAGFGMVVLIFIPTSNSSIRRFQSAFQPSDDASFKLRKFNQTRIQPFILTHPMGGGLGATGAWGKRFSPGSFLANFPPDSGYVRVAVELGWVGLFIFCMLVFVILRTGINDYYHIRDPELKSYCLGMVLVVFCLNIGNYPQEALVQFPNNIYFYMVAALIGVIRQLDQEKTNQLNEQSA